MPPGRARRRRGTGPRRPPGLSIRRPVFAVVVSLLLVVLGLMSFMRLTLRELPNIDPPLGSVEVNYPGALRVLDAVLPALLTRFSAAHPQLVATLHDSNAAQMVAQVLSREADLALGSDIGQTHSELATERLFSERMALFLRHDHPLAQRASVQGRDLDGLPLVHVNPDAVVWRAISRELSAVANVYPQVVHHVSMLTTAFGMIQAGAGVALLPRYVARLMPPDLRAVPIVRPVLEFPIVAIRLAKQPLSPAAMAFLAMARQHLKPSLV